MKNQNQDWLTDYSEFLNSNQTTVPKDLTTDVLAKMERLLRPSALSVFAKMFFIHLITGFLSFAICHQFELNPFKTSHSLSDLFMDIGGHGFCMVACGVLFISLSIFLAGFFLTIEETKALRRTEFLQILALGIMSLGSFIAVGAEVALTLGGLWIIGGLIGGLTATEILWKVKRT